MRRDQIALDRQPFLVPVTGRPNVLALVAPPTPRSLPDGARFIARFADAHAALGRLQGVMQHLPNSDMVTRTLARREAVRSSQIEGTRTNLHQLLTYEATRGMNGLPVDVKVTERYVEALQRGLTRIRQQGRAAIDSGLIHELHATLMQDEAGKIRVGAYRGHQAWIGTGRRIEDASFVPTPAEYIQECMDEMTENILQYAPQEDEQGALTLVAQLAIAHAQFETIHPYEDGNGRTGRLLLPLMLAAEGYPPLYLSGLLLRAREAYYSALLSVQLRGDWEPWTTLLIACVVEACNESIDIAQDLVALCTKWEEQLSGYRSDSAMRRLPRFLLGHPVVSVQQVVEGLGVSQPAANAALNKLVTEGILSLVDQRRWGRVFQSTEILERLDRPPR